ncbi:MAG: methylamine utilization protein, partial [Planctomycetota bacterium]
AGVSNESGEIVIEGLPAGDELTFRVWHEKGKIDEVSIDGKDEKWRRSRFEVDIEPGMNDLGVITVPAEAFE